MAYSLGNGNRISLGMCYTDKGSIFVVLLSTLLSSDFDDAEAKAHITLKGHTGSVSCLWCPDPREVGGSRFLLSGGADGSVRVWNIE